jgi:hypothetical protein
VKRRVAASLVALTVLGLVGGLAFASAASADDSSNSNALTVTVGPTEANTPGPGLESGSGSVSGGGSGSGAVPTPAPATSASPSATPKPGESDLGGILYLSGLSSNYVWSFNPAKGEVVLQITLRNVSKSTFDSTARLWIDTSLGNTVSELKGVRIDGLRPNETRVVTGTMTGLGQWTVLQAHAMIAPPETVDGVALAPITRDTYVFVPPLLAGGIGAFGVGVFFLGKFLWALRLAARARGIL